MDLVIGTLSLYFLGYLEYLYMHVCLVTVIYGSTVGASDDLISGFQFRYDIDMIFLKYRDIDKNRTFTFSKAVCFT